MAKTITQNKPEEYLQNRNKTKEIYFFKDIDNGIDQISREVFLNRDKEIHYPTPYKGKSKYINIDKFTYILYIRLAVSESRQLDRAHAVTWIKSINAQTCDRVRLEET